MLPDHQNNTIQIILESALSNYDSVKIKNNHIDSLINWNPTGNQKMKFRLLASRVVSRTYIGVPLLADLAAMRDCAQKYEVSPKMIEPLVPVDLVIDHSLQTNYTNRPEAAKLNMELEFARISERYQFMKWGGRHLIPSRSFPGCWDRASS